jgi:branched-chain amino acid transport system substrate-binding protein
LRLLPRFRVWSGILGVVACAGVATAADQPIKVGLMLPATGTYASLGTAIENGFRLYLEQQGGKLAGRSVQVVTIDDESSPARATDNINRLIRRDKVDAVVGTVHSGVAMAMVRVAKATDTLLIIPNAGAAAFTGTMCAPNVFRTSFTNWQPAYAMGVAAAQRGAKTAVTISWRYASGEESANGFKEGFEKHGGQVVDQLYLPFPNVEFQPLITRIASIKPDATYAFFAGGGAVKFVNDYVAAGLKQTISLYSPGFLTEGTLQGQGQTAQGLYSVMHYADGLDTPKDNAFRAAYQQAFGEVPDVYAVQGYDAAQLLAAGLEAVHGDVSRKTEMYAAMSSAVIDSPRGPFTLSHANNPIQAMYLREVDGMQNKFIGVAMPALEDPAVGCRM